MATASVENKLIPINLVSAPCRTVLWQTEEDFHLTNKNYMRNKIFSYSL